MCVCMYVCMYVCGYLVHMSMHMLYKCMCVYLSLPLPLSAVSGTHHLLPFQCASAHIVPDLWLIAADVIEEDADLGRALHGRGGSP